MEELNNRVLDFILDNLNNDGSLNNVYEYRDYFDVINSLIDIGRVNDSKKILGYLSKFQNRNGDFNFNQLKLDFGKYNSIFYLNSLSKYLIASDNNLEVKYFLKILKRCILSLRNYFDDEYLLFFRYDYLGNKSFSILENASFLSISLELSDLLNKYGYNKLADDLFMLNGKVDLGFKRYFLQKEFIIGNFSKDLESFEGLDELSELILFNEFDFDMNLINSRLKDFSKMDLDHFLFRLNYYLLLRNSGNKYLSFLKKDLKFLMEIPITLVPKKFDGTIEKSLFNKEVSIIEIKGKKENVLIRPLYRLRVAALILRLVYNEK